MLEITKDMLDQTIEAERKNKAASDKAVQITAYIMIGAIAAEFAVLFKLLRSSFLSALIYVAIILSVDFVVFFGVTILMSKKYISGFTVGAFFHALKNQKYNSAILAADEKEKERLYGNRYANAKGEEKLLASNGVIGICLRMNDFDRAEKIINETAGIEPKNFLQRCIKVLNYFAFYGARNDKENYIKTYRENEKVIDEMWNNTLDTKIEAVRYTAIYLACTEQYEKAIEYYDYLFDFQNQAAEIDPKLAVTDELLNALNIDLAELYCNSGNKEKAAECFRKAKEFFADTEIQFIKYELERVGEILDEAGIDYS